MPSPNEKLAESLDVLEALQQGNQRVFRSDDLSRVHRERLMENGFLQEVMKGWLISSSPDARAGESTPWHASFWEFCARYCDERFGQQWHLSPEQSLFLHGERAVHLKPDTSSARRAVRPLRSWLELRCFGNRCVARSSRCSPKRRDFRQTLKSIFASSTKSIGPMPTTRCPLKATPSRLPWWRKCGRAAGTRSMTPVIAEIATLSRRGDTGKRSSW